MTDTEIKRRKAICEAANVEDIDDVSDGFHTFRQLYYQRMVLFAAIVKQNKDKAWKSLRHEDGELCFGGGWFIVGVDTPEGSYTYHYEDNYYSLFDCKELERGKHWDGHTEKDVTRLLSLPPAQLELCEDCVSRKSVIRLLHSSYHSKSMIDEVKELPPVQPEPLTDREQRIFLAAMGREEKVCEEVERNRVLEAYEDSLMWVCREIKRKVKGALWT